MIVGQTLQLTKTITPSYATEVTVWTSSEKNVAKVDASSGLVTTIGVGTATITVKSSNTSASCIVTVTTGGYIVGYGDNTSSADGNVVKLNNNGQKVWEYKTHYIANSVAQVY